MDRLIEITRGLGGLLEYHLEAGVDAILDQASEELGPQISTQKSTDTLDSIREELGNCERCNLSEGRTNIVFGEGSPHAELVFVGEGPGREEDIEGRPFVGEAGRLLTKIIEAIDLKREEVYICNVVKCRPPNNRTPMPDETNTCFPFLARQIEVIRPRIICVLGAVAASSLIGEASTITRLRGKWKEFQGIKVMPTFHPAYLLRSPDKKRPVWEDMKQIRKELQGK